MASPLIGHRLKALREEKKLSQDELARYSASKTARPSPPSRPASAALTAEELLLAVQKLGVSFDYFTDPFRLVGEGHFNWRQSGVPAQVLNAYERVAGQLIAAFRTLGTEIGEKPPLERRLVRLTKTSRFEEAAEAGERFAAEHNLGDVPATRLAEVMERDLNILVLMVTPNHSGVSGAACRLPDLDVVLINRDEVPGRRHFDLAHELFHILTWDAMPPVHIEEVTETGGANRVEQLANAFASALLMPARIIESRRRLAYASRRRADRSAQRDGRPPGGDIARRLMWRLVSVEPSREIHCARRTNGYRS